MNTKSCFKLIAAALLFALVLIGAGSAATITEPAYSIEGLTITPSTLMPGETGTLQFTLRNTGNIPLVVDKISVTDSENVISVKHPAITSLGAIGAGKTLTITLPITAKEDSEGTFYPTLYVDFKYDSTTFTQYTYLKYPFAVTVDDSSVSVSITDRPEVFEPGTTQVIGLSIGNLRSNQIDSVMVTASGEGVSCEEGSVFAGTIQPGEYSDVSLTVITSDKTEEINLEVSYKNGANWHTEIVTIPVEGGELKTGAELLINNVEVTSGTSYQTITGDVNNAGLETAKGLVVTLEGAETTQPYPVYVVGSLDADGLSEFELTFTNSESDEITLVFTYKDENGNTYTQKESVSVSASQNAGGSSTGGNPVVATIAVILLIVIVGGAVFLVWKKGNLLPKKEQK